MKIRVYVADDHAMIRDGLRALLESHGDIEVVGGAGDGRQAVVEAKRLQPDIVLMDISMPGLNGIEAAALLREAAPKARVIMLSMHANSEHLFRALHAGARGYVLKNSAGAELADAVREVHAGKRHFSPKVAEILVEGYVREERVASPMQALSAREREILQLVAEGRTSAQIADALSLSPKTVDTYRSRLMQKIGVTDMVGLVKFAILHGVTPLE